MSRTADRGQIYQLRIDLERSKPPIWRRVLVPAAASLQALHQVIQRVMGWDNSHLHQFEIGNRLVGAPEQWSDEDDFWDDPEILDEADITLADLGLGEGYRFHYVYDFGDNWPHEIKLEKVLERDPETHYPVCIKAVKAAPPEDVGGIYGYHAMLEALDDPAHPDHNRLREWLMVDEWDPEAVDPDGINDALRPLCI